MKKYFAIAFLVVVSLMVFIPDASATGVLDDITTQYGTAASSFGPLIFQVALKLFGMLIVIEFCWSAALWALEKDDVGSFGPLMIKKLLSIGFFYWLMKDGPTFMSAIIQSLITLGKQSSGLPALTPSGVLDQGIAVINLVTKTFNNSSALPNWLTGLAHPFLSMVLSFACFAIIIAFVLLAAAMSFTLIEMYFALAIAPLMFAFGGTRWTADMATAGLRLGLHIGLKFLGIYFCAGVSVHMVQAWGPLIATMSPTDFTPLWKIMGGSILLAYIALRLPNAVPGWFSGNSANMSAGDAVASVAAVGAGVAAAGAGVAALGASAAAAGASTGVGNAAQSVLSQAASAFTGGGGISGGGGGGATPMPPAPVAPPSPPSPPSLPVSGKGTSASSAAATPSSSAAQPPAPAEGVSQPPAAAEHAASTSSATSAENSSSPDAAPYVPPPAAAPNTANSAGSGIAPPGGNNATSQNDKPAQSSRKLHDQIYDLGKYVPAEQAPTSGFNIRINHTE